MAADPPARQVQPWRQTTLNMWKFMVGMALLVNAAYGQKKVPVVRHGASPFVIDVDRRDELALKAAQVVKKYTAESTGVVLPFIWEKGGEMAIVIRRVDENDERMEDSYGLHYEQGKLYITGVGRGVVFAAYRYVRDIIGACKWYAGRENTDIPKLEELYIDEGLHISAAPAFVYREVYFPVELDPEYMDWYGLHNLEEKWGEWGHTFNKILPPAIYFKKHPAYYAWYNGRRQPTQLCLSNEEVFARTVDYFREKMENNPSATYWSIGPNDALGHCTCAQCSKTNEREGGPQGTLIRFVNRVARTFPGKKFTTLAYLQTANAPLHEHAEDNVYVMLSNVDASRKQNIGIEPSAGAFRRQLQDWTSKSRHVFVWDYITQFTGFLTPFPVQGTMQQNVQYLKSAGAEGIFLQGGGGTYSDMAELNAYVLAHLLWNPDADEGRLTDEFINGYYGKGAPYVKTYLEARRLNLLQEAHSLSIYGNPIDHRNDFLRPEAMERYSVLLEKAEVAVEGERLFEDRVRRIGLGLDYTYLQQSRFYGPRRHGIFIPDGKKWAVRPYVRQKVDRFVRDSRRLGVVELSEGGRSPEGYGAGWDVIFAQGLRPNKASGADVSLVHPYDPSFPANGVATLTDSVPGYDDHSYNWLMWYGTPMDATIQLKEAKRIGSVEVNFLQDARHWIFPPKTVEIFVSVDGVHFRRVMHRNIRPVEEDYTVRRRKYRVAVKEPIKAVRVYAEPFGALPSWRFHPYKKVMIACDEIWLD